MSSISCCTCKETFSTDDISKHLSSTRHKLVKYDKLDEIIECEDCDDTNIHQLQILRFGLNDMTLLCQTCLNKQEKPSIQYSLSNGSFFKKIDQYYKFRDIECHICGADNRLFVGNSNKQQYIVCRNCLPQFQESNSNVKFISENDDFFLSELLGLTEAAPKTKPKVSRGRKLQKGGKRKKELNPTQAKEAEERRDHYFNKIAESKQIRSGSTIKAVGTDAPTKSTKPTQKSDSRSKPPKHSPGSQAGSKAGSRFGSKNNSASSSKSNSAKQSYNNTPKSSLPNSSRQSRESTPSGVPKPNKLTKSDLPKAVNEKLNQHTKTDKPGKDLGKSGKDKNSKGAKFDKSTKNQGGNGTKGPAPKSNGKPNGPPGSNGKATGSNAVALGPKRDAKKDIKKDSKQGSTKKDQEPKSALPKNTKDKNEVEPKDLPLPKGIIDYEPSKEPKLQYDSLDSYFKEMSYNLFLEEKLSISTSQSEFIDANEVVLSWYADNDKKNKMYKVEVPMTQEFKDKFLSKKIQKFKKVPFSVDQAIFLVLNGKIPWYGRVILAESAKQQKRLKHETLELVIEQYPWNFQPLPVSVNIKFLSILPASVPVSRVFLAMSRIDNPKFKKMLLGKEPIRHIDFNNYVKFSDESKFNQSQKVALQSVLNNSITALQGPPGTGKTSTIHEIILQLLNNFNTYPILVVAASNIAIDNIAEKLLGSHGRSLLRIVSAEKESDYNSNHDLNSICLHTKIMDMLPNVLKETMFKLRSPFASDVSVNQYKKLRSKQVELSNLLIAQARVIFTTSVVAGGNQLKSVKKFPVVIMDESTQSSESTTLIPLSMPGVDKFVFVGDQKQLSSFTQVPNLSLSLFERVLLNGTYKTPHMLDTQYRMHPMISEFPRNKFYEGKLKDGITESQRFIDLIEKPIQFWDTKGNAKEQRVKIRTREDNGYTYNNPGEITNIVEVLIKLIYEKKIEKSKIGIITPYRGQRDLISNILSKNDLINPEKDDIKVEVDRDDIYNESKPITIHTVSDIMIASIDAFQGREKDFIIFSCVRSNDDRKIGFLNDERRLNVALTRAKYGLILIGDYGCLSNDSLWNEYLSHLSQKQLVNDTSKFTY